MANFETSGGGFLMALIQLKLYSATLKTRTNVNVIIPTVLPPADGLTKRCHEFDEFYETHGKYPVLYLLHGTYGDEGDWVRYSRIEDYARQYNVVVVMPSCENSCYKNTTAGKDYEVYITRELPKMIQWMFPVSKRREDTFIGGLSMGGGGAVRLGLSLQDIYGCTIGLSADLGMTPRLIEDNEFTVWSHAFDREQPVKGTVFDSKWLADQAMGYSGEHTKLYIACGTEDFLYQENCNFHEYMNKIGFNHVFSTSEGNHNWNFWDSEIFKVLKWLPVTSMNRQPIRISDKKEK